MNITLALISRNLNVYLRDRTAIFFSFLSVIIIIGLYALFLGDLQVSIIKSIAGDLEGIEWLVNGWIMAGILTVNTVNITMAALGVMITDVETNASKDFISSPIKRGQVILGYIGAAWILGIVMTLAAFFVVQFFIVFNGGEFLSFIATLKVIGVVIVSVISFSSMLFFSATFIRSSKAYGTFNSILGTLIGFLAGVYIPLGQFPDTVQKVVTVFPVSYSAAMMRQIFIEKPINKVFKHAPAGTMQEYKEFNGISLVFNDYEFSWWLMIGILIALAFLFYLLSVLRLMKNKI
ncbi:ABC transporter permease [Haloplasma contractile]|uniref:ABC transporter protein n=1 Tax=Haloplasma contractile SSD-17B TaxID=1033810 RepID=U2DZA5_9MOLU|nr:ABC transporter permease [Haloplasma contractile]ERJ13542.1 ABC transporter protein [Haloplasma contractile SSD-17B]